MRTPETADAAVAEFERALHGDAGDQASVTGWVVDVLAGIIDGRRELRAVRHPLGFICFPVVRTDTDGICVHLWHEAVATASPTTSQLHAHSWDLLSLVLFGEVRNEIVVVRDDPARPTHRIFEIHSSADGDEIRATPRLVRPATDAMQTHRAGAVYALGTGAFHTSTVPAGVPTATVALGQGRAGARDLSLGPLDGATHRIRRQRCSQMETIAAARVVAEHLAAVGGQR
jgi:hypothetical protein